MKDKAGDKLQGKTIKVLQFFGSLNMGGAECRMMDVYRDIDKTKFHFDFVTLTSDKQFFEDEITSLGGEVFRLDSPRKVGVKKHIYELRECIRKGNYDAVHAHTSYHCGMVMLAAWLEHIPVRISHARTTGSKKKTKFRIFSLLIGRMLINLFSTKKLAISNDSGKYVFGNHQFEVLPNAIDLKKYQNVTSNEVNKIKTELGIEKSDFVVGQIGRFASMKNHEFTINWFSGFLKDNLQSKLILVGDGELKTNIQKTAREKELMEHIVFTGVRDDVCKLIHVFDVLFFPSVFEGLGGVVLEAQAAGIPVVESDSVPFETDIGLGLVQRVSLQDDIKKWNEAVLRSKEISIPSFYSINQMFKKKRYTLSEIVNRLSELYEGKT